jgi:hypothetical protein
MVEATPSDAPVTSPETVERAFPELDELQYDENRELAREVLESAPDYFWTAPASTSGNYHPLAARETGGLLVHTKFVFSLYQRLAESFVAMEFMTDYEADCGRVACLVHDLLKQGLPEDHDVATGHTVDGHDLLAAEWLLDVFNAPNAVHESVAAHMGDWDEGPRPRLGVTLAVHAVDMVASDAALTPAVRDDYGFLAENYDGFVVEANDSARVTLRD